MSEANGPRPRARRGAEENRGPSQVARNLWGRALGGTHPERSYGRAADASAPGSGGGTRDDAQAYGGDGGGAILIEASGDVIVDGSLLADGTQANFYSGGGSGGGISVVCKGFGGTGQITANGGARGNNGGAGGGGRIALTYQRLIGTPAIRIEAREAAHQLAWGDPLLRWAPYRWMAEPGTIHLSDATLLPPVVSNLYGVVSLDGAAAWAPDSLTVDGARLMFAPGFDLSVTNGVTVRGGGTLEMIHPAGFSCGGTLLLDNGRLAMNGFTQMLCQGDLTVTNGGVLLAASAPTNGLAAHGAALDVAGDLAIGAGSWVMPDNDITNGGPVRIRARQVRVAAGGGFDADGRGFGGGLGMGWAEGYGPGAGYQSTYGSGAGYGGRGGDAFYSGWTALGGAPYGSTNAPVMPGSGGGGY